MQGPPGARTAWTAGAQGQGSRPQAVSVTGGPGYLDTRRCYLQCTGPPKTRLCCACGRRVCDEAAGTRVPRGSRVSGIRQRGGIADNSSCVWKPEASFMTVPNEAKPILRARCLPPGSVRWSCAGPLAFAADGRSRPGRQSVMFRHAAKRRVPKGGAESSQSGGLGFVSWAALFALLAGSA
jgi:hypothetical protein